MNSRRIRQVFIASALVWPGPASAQKLPPTPTASAVKPAAVGPAANQILIQTSIEATNRAGVVGEKLEFKATLKFGQPPKSVSGHELKFLVGGALACAGKTDASAAVSCTWKISPIPQGTVPYEVRFDGDEQPVIQALAAPGASAPHLATSKVTKSLLVAKAPTTLTLKAFGDFEAGKKMKIEATLRESDGTMMKPSGITLTLNGKDVAIPAQVGPAGAVFEYLIPPGTAGLLKFEAFYPGDESLNATSGQLVKTLPYYDSSLASLLIVPPLGTLSVQKGALTSTYATIRAVLKLQSAPGDAFVAAQGATVKFYACEPNGDCAKQIGFAITNAQGVASQDIAVSNLGPAYPLSPPKGNDRFVRIEGRYEGDPVHRASHMKGDLVIHEYTQGKSPI